MSHGDSELVACALENAKAPATGRPAPAGAAAQLRGGGAHAELHAGGGELFLTQSAVSRQIQQLEASLGVLLFERRHRALALTEAGARAAARGGRKPGAAARRHRAPARRAGRCARSRSPARRALPRCGSFRGWRVSPPTTRRSTCACRPRSRCSTWSAAASTWRCASCRSSRGTGPALFEESVMPLCAPQLAAPLRAPADLAEQTLLTIDVPEHAEAPTVDWEPWLEDHGPDRAAHEEHPALHPVHRRGGGRGGRARAW